MSDERTCRTCWHWGVIEPGQGLCGHPDTGGAVHGADDTCCNHLAIVGRGGDWQPHEQLSGGSAPAEDWREPMVDASNSSNPPEDVEQRAWTTCPICHGVGASTETVAHSPGGVETRTVTPCLVCNGTGMVDVVDALPKQRVAELEAENERLRAALMPLETSSIACAVQEAAAATMQRDQLQAALELERRAVEALAEHIETACEGFAHGGMSAMEVAPGGYTDAAEIAAWARNRARDAESGE